MASTKTAKTDVATTEENAIASFVASGDNLPEHAQNGSGVGNENVGAGDMAIPRIKLLQDLSPETKESKAEYVAGAKPGLMLNTVTQELSDKLYVVNLYFDHEWAVFRHRDFGGGFEGNAATADEAWAMAAQKAGSMEQAKTMMQVVETGRHTVGILDPQTGELFPAIIDMTSTKLRVSAGWNTDIARLGGDRFSSIWEITPVEQTKRQNTFFNYKVKYVGWASQDIYEAAKKKYEEIASARSRSMSSDTAEA